MSSHTEDENIANNKVSTTNPNKDDSHPLPPHPSTVSEITTPIDTTDVKAVSSNDDCNCESDKQHDVDPTLLEPFYYITSVPGKDVRSMLIDCFQVWFQVDDVGLLDTIKDIIGDLHNASLLIDDIEDNSCLRRGIPVAHAIFGIPTVLNCANYVYFLALEKCQSLNHAAATKVFTRELLNLHRGQGYDIAWREMSRCPSEEQYIAMVRDKTGGLFRLAVGLLQSFATQHKHDNFYNLVNDLGLYFQIRDDYINLADEEYFKSKSFCEDITEGKFSYPIVHCIQNSQRNNNGHEAQRLLSILKQRTQDIEVKRYAQTLMKDSGSLDYTREKCRSLRSSIVEEVEKLGGNPSLLALIDKLQVQLETMDSNISNDNPASKTSNTSNIHAGISLASNLSPRRRDTHHIDEP